MRTVLAFVSSCLVLLAAGCATQGQAGATRLPMPHPYPEGDLTLILIQDRASSDLTLTLRNASPHIIANRYPETTFEGTLWVVQEGAAPLKIFPSNYYHLLLRALWQNPLKELSPGESLTYKIPLKALVSPFSSRCPDPKQPVFAYAVLDKFEVFSNTIRLERPDSIQWEARIDGEQ